MRYQRGVSLSGLLMVSFLIGILAVLAMKVFPDVLEYWNIRKTVNAVAADSSLKGKSVTDIRNAYTRRASVDSISAITATDLDISKDGNDVVLSFAYTRQIPLFGPVSLLIDFEGSSAK